MIAYVMQSMAFYGNQLMTGEGEADVHSSLRVWVAPGVGLYGQLCE